MRLYDFSIYAQRRREREASTAVAEAAATINYPGSVVVLKARINDWFDLHREVLKQANSS